LEFQRLAELRARAIEIHFECEVRLGESGQVIGRLRAEASASRYRERLWALLMVALAQEGRRAEAIRAYDEARAMLAEIGLEPCAELRELADHVVREAPDCQAHLIA
jgi:DNA-binding SARP family transcriptional activator